MHTVGCTYMSVVTRSHISLNVPGVVNPLVWVVGFVAAITLAQYDLLKIDIECTYPSFPLTVEKTGRDWYLHACLRHCERHRSKFLWINIPGRVFPWPRDSIDRSHSSAMLLRVPVGKVK